MPLSLITFVANTLIKAADFNSNFNAINAQLFSLDEDNFSPGAQLPDSILDTIVTPGKVDGASIVAQTIDAVKGQFIWTVAGTVATGTSVGFPYRPSATLIAQSVFLEVVTAPLGSALIIDIKKNGSTMFTTKPQINDGQLTGGSGAVFANTDLVLNDKLTLDINLAGTTTPASNLVIYLRCKQKVPQS